MAELKYDLHVKRGRKEKKEMKNSEKKKNIVNSLGNE